MKQKYDNLTMIDLESMSLTGIDGLKTLALGYVILQLSFGGEAVKHSVPLLWLTILICHAVQF